jgi:hypothetical protein
MPQVLHRGLRSSILSYESGEVTRKYHDTGKEASLPVTVDCQGVFRTSANRSLAANTEYRGGASRERPTPLHIKRALATLLNTTERDVRSFSQLLGVKESTGWCYLCHVAEAFPWAKDLVLRMVHPPLLQALESVDRKGSLREVMKRLDTGPLKGCTEWRCVDNHYSHLRLARVCLTVSSKEGQSCS